MSGCTTHHECDCIEAERTSLKRKLRLAEEAITDVITHHWGLKHHWAGLWSDCKRCSDMFAYAGNWSNHNEDSPPDECPTCRARIILQDIRQSALRGEGWNNG